MPIVLYNTKTKKKDVLVPLIPGQVSMYVCGVTVYDDCHLGHARSALTFELIRRYLEFSGYQVTYVRNFTDIDDKILNRAQQEGVPWNDISARYIQAFYRDMEALGITTKPSAEPRATEHMQDILTMVESIPIGRSLGVVEHVLVEGMVIGAIEPDRRFSPGHGQ